MTHDEAVKRAKKIVLKHLPAPKDYITSSLEEDFVKELQQSYQEGMNSSLAHIGGFMTTPIDPKFMEMAQKSLLYAHFSDDDDDEEEREYAIISVAQALASVASQEEVAELKAENKILLEKLERKMTRGIKVFRLNDYDWWAGESLESVKKSYMEATGLDEFEAFDDDYELSEEDMNREIYTDEDGSTRTFKEQLNKMIAENRTFPEVFASVVQ